MEITYRRLEGNVLVVVAEGTVEERNAEALLAETTRAIDAGVRRVVIDCTHLRYVSSYGLGTLVRIHKRLVERQGALVFAGVGDRLLTQLRLVRLHEVFGFAASVEDAAR